MPDRARKSRGVDDGTNLLLSILRCGRRAFLPRVEIEHDFVSGWNFRDEGGQCLYGTRELLIPNVSGEDMDACTVLDILSGDAAVPVGVDGAKVGERTHAIVAGDHGLKHQLAQEGRRAGKAAGQEADQRLRAIDER